MKISVAILEHYPQFENDVVKSIGKFDDVFLINDYNSKLENKNIHLINAGISLKEKIEKAFEINNNEYLLFIDGDDLFNKFNKDSVLNIINKYNVGMYKFYSKYNKVINNKKSVIYAINNGLDNHISGTMINTNIIVPEYFEDFSVDKQFFYYGLNDCIINFNTNYIIKRNNIYSKMHSIKLNTFYYNTMTVFNLFKYNGNVLQKYYASLIYDNNYILANKISMNSFNIAIRRLFNDRYFKPLVSIMRKI